jgi:hypothetical protein
MEVTMTPKPLNIDIMSEAVERVRRQLKLEQELVRDDVAEVIEDYDALAEVHRRVMRQSKD